MKKLYTLVAVIISLHAFSQGQFQNETAGSISFAAGQVQQLAAAFPAENYAWTPQEGIRSVTQVCTHIISANYFFASKLGATLPADVNMEALEKSLTTKDAIAKELKRSFDVISTTIKNTKDESLQEAVEFPFPGQYTKMSASLIALSHANEHLGQLIAYARTTGVVPPWSQTD